MLIASRVSLLLDHLSGQLSEHQMFLRLCKNKKRFLYPPQITDINMLPLSQTKRPLCVLIL